MAELTMADVLTHYGGKVDVPESGWRSVKCPFHDDTCASAGVNLGQNAFACHACPVHGDPIGVIMMVEKMGYREACEWSAKILGKSSPSISPAISSRGQRQKRRGRKWRALFD